MAIMMRAPLFFYPKMNLHCRDALAKYTACLTNDHTFKIWTLESFVDAIQSCSGGEYVTAIRDRHLDFEEVEERILM